MTILKCGQSAGKTHKIKIVEKIIPFFKRCPFQSESKTKNFTLFKQIADIVYSGEHLARKGFMRIVELHEKLNEGKGRKRKYEKRDVVQDFERILRNQTSDKQKTSA